VSSEMEFTIKLSVWRVEILPISKLILLIEKNSFILIA